MSSDDIECVQDFAWELGHRPTEEAVKKIFAGKGVPLDPMELYATLEEYFNTHDDVEEYNMRLLEIYKMQLVKVGDGNQISDFIVKLKAEGKKTICVNAEELLRMKAFSHCVSENGKQVLIMHDLDQVEIVGEAMYDGFHEIREKVRYLLMKEEALHSEIEEINRSLAEYELGAYIDMEKSQRTGFSRYFRERYPERSQKKFSHNIGFMFRAYRKEFEKYDELKETVEYESVQYRTKENRFGEKYVYPIRNLYERRETTYIGKVVICTWCEMGLL